MRKIRVILGGFLLGVNTALTGYAVSRKVQELVIRIRGIDMVRGTLLFIAAGLLCVGLAATGNAVGTVAFPAAIAQTDTVIVQPSSLAGTIWVQVQPAVLTAVSTILAALAIWLGTWIADFFKVKNEETRKKILAATRDLAHAVAWNAVKFAAAKSDSAIMDQLSESLPPPPDLMSMARKYFLEMNPDLSETLSGDEIDKILTSKIPDLINLVKPKSTTIVNSNPSK